MLIITKIEGGFLIILNAACKDKDYEILSKLLKNKFKVKAIDNLSNVALNTNASRGRIEDADFAKESARLTKAQILQQSAMAMIAQAGKAQQNVLQLLQN